MEMEPFPGRFLWQASSRGLKIFQKRSPTCTPKGKEPWCRPIAKPERSKFEICALLRNPNLALTLNLTLTYAVCRAGKLVYKLVQTPAFRCVFFFQWFSSRVCGFSCCLICFPFFSSLFLSFPDLPRKPLFFCCCCCLQPRTSCARFI